MAHLPVLLEEVVSQLALKDGDIVVDATCGGGGHSEKIAREIAPGGRLIAIDRDPAAIERTKERLKDAPVSVTFINDNFRNIEGALESLGVAEIDGALFDLGLSSFQIDSGDRGFSFRNDGPLDMRFDPDRGISAAEVVNTFDVKRLSGIIKEFGEERHSDLVSRKIREYRKTKKIETTGELKDVVVLAIGRWYRKEKLHPAARTFQALRIYVNDELAAAGDGIGKAINHLRPGRRICVISFHSMEDRVVKNIFRERRKQQEIRVITKKPIYPGAREITDNPRSRSAKLRVAEKA